MKQKAPNGMRSTSPLRAGHGGDGGASDAGGDGDVDSGDGNGDGDEGGDAGGGQQMGVTSAHETGHDRTRSSMRAGVVMPYPPAVHAYPAQEAQSHRSNCQTRVDPRSSG